MNKNMNDDQMRALFDHSGMEKPSQNFEDKVMDAVAELGPKKAPTPLITLKGWVLIAASIIAICTIAIALGEPTVATDLSEASNSQQFLDRLFGGLGHLTRSVGGLKVSTMAGMSLICLFGLVALDQVLQKRSLTSLPVL